MPAYVIVDIEVTDPEDYKNTSSWPNTRWHTRCDTNTRVPIWSSSKGRNSGNAMV